MFAIGMMGLVSRRFKR
ncbi:hypothetical protein [Colwellia sp. 75C3]